MKYGCIGEHLKHSFSKEIHALLANYEYEIKEIPAAELDAFMRAREFTAINVTIPYKERVMPYLDYIDGQALAIGAVNTIVNKCGKLYGYNTDFFGMSELIRHADICVSEKKVAILGTGGTAKTAFAVATALGAKEILRVSRNAVKDAVSYEELYEKHSDTDIIINTTPVGMFPNSENCPIDISKFPSLSGVIDAIYNPLRTRLISEAKEQKIPAEGGLYMLVAQAVRASEIFTETKFGERVLDKTFEKILNEKENIVLIGMPSSGKSTVGKIIADKLSREFIDTDSLIVNDSGMEISRIFTELGEDEFRKMEADAVRRASERCGLVIATGGGAPLFGKNLMVLKQNGRVFFIDRPLCELIPTEDRPLSNSKDAVKKLYSERYELYLKSADKVIIADKDAALVAREIVNESIHN